jgi:hypothetical protein
MPSEALAADRSSPIAKPIADRQANRRRRNHQRHGLISGLIQVYAMPDPKPQLLARLQPASIMPPPARGMAQASSPSRRLKLSWKIAISGCAMHPGSKAS